MASCSMRKCAKLSARLELSGYTLDLSKLHPPRFFYSCNCQDSIHYGLCVHCIALARQMELITAIPSNLDPTSRRRGKGRRGRLPKAKPGEAFGERDSSASAEED